MWMLDVDFIRAPAIGEVIQHNFDNLGVAIVNPGPPFGVKVNMVRCRNSVHD